MADFEFYKLSMSGKEADAGIRTGMQAGATGGILFGDGNGGVRTATPGADYGYPLLTGNGAPNNNTAANLGQHYFDMAATQPPYEFICVGYNAQGFVWLVFGDTGSNFTVNGIFSSLEALDQAIAEGIVPLPTPGVAYGIGTVPPYEAYIWDVATENWSSVGLLNESTSSSVPPHGNAGQSLIKYSDADYDVGWGSATDIAPGAVGEMQLANSSVGTDKIQNASIIRDKLAADAVTETYTATLLSSAWTRITPANGYYYHQDISDLPVLGKLIMDVDLSGFVATTADAARAQIVEEEYGNIYLAIFTKAGVLRVFSRELPTVDIPLKFMGVHK